MVLHRRVARHHFRVEQLVAEQLVAPLPLRAEQLVAPLPLRAELLVAPLLPSRAEQLVAPLPLLRAEQLRRMSTLHLQQVEGLVIPFWRRVAEVWHVDVERVVPRHPVALAYVVPPPEGNVLVLVDPLHRCGRACFCY